MRIDDRIGESSTWTLPVTDSEPITVKGLYLGMSSSHSNRHRAEAHAGGVQWATPGERCSACRWAEFRIFRELDDEETPYLLHKTGASAVPGETPRHKFEEMLSARGLIETMTMRRPDRPPFLPIPAGRVLSQATAFDEVLREAWDSRLVV